MIDFSSIVYADNPKAYYRLDDKIGPTAIDLLGLQNGTYTGTVTLGAAGLAGDANKGISVAGAGYVSVGNPAALQLSSGTVEARFKTTMAGTGTIVGKVDTVVIYVKSGHLYTYDYGSTNPTFIESDTGVVVNDGLKHHVMIVFDSGVTNGTTVYLDGVSVWTGTQTVNGQTHEWEIGQDTDGSPFTGSIDEVAIYSTKLSAARALAHATWVSDGFSQKIFPDLPIAYYRMSDPSGINVVDEIGNHPGTVSGRLGHYVQGLTGDGDEAMAFDGGAGNYIVVDNSAEMQFPQGTIEGFFKFAPITIPGKNAFVLFGKSNAWDLYFDPAGSTLNTYNYTTSTVNSVASTWSDGKRHHVALVVDSGVTNGSQVWVDGVAVITCTITILGNLDPFQIGFDGFPANEFAGVLDEVAVYNYKLTPTQIATHAAGFLAPSSSNAVVTLSGSPTNNGDSSYKIDDTGSDRVQAPLLGLDETQSWVIARLRMGFASSANLGGGATRPVFQWADDSSNFIEFGWRDVAFGGTDGQWAKGRMSGGSGGNGGWLNDTFALSAKRTIGMKWTATQNGLSLNGAAWAMEASTAIPVLAATLFDIGSRGGSLSISSDVLWLAWGVGNISDADVATFNALGDTDPDPNSTPATANCLGVWKANDTSIATIGVNQLIVVGAAKSKFIHLRKK